MTKENQDTQEPKVTTPTAEEQLAQQEADAAANAEAVPEATADENPLGEGNKDASALHDALKQLEQAVASHLSFHESKAVVTPEGHAAIGDALDKTIEEHEALK
jgi:hypothetical protein